MIGYDRRRRRSVSASPNTFRGRRPESSTATRSNCPDGAYLSGSRFVGVISRRRTETASAADSQPSIASRRFSSVDDRSASAPPVTSRGPRIGHYEAETTFIARGLGISFTTEASGRLYNRPGIVYVPIVDRPPSFTPGVESVDRCTREARFWIVARAGTGVSAN